ncbi:MAG: class I SAM-dependent methyltransferase [Solirubrobacteraceae bacterium]
MNQVLALMWCLLRRDYGCSAGQSAQTGVGRRSRCASAPQRLRPSARVSDRDRCRVRDHPGMMRDPDSWWLDERGHAGREHFDEQHARRYDAKEDAQAAEEVSLLQDGGVLGPGCSVVDLGAGSGQFVLAAARVCARVVAVDVSPLMLARLAEKLDRCAASNVEAICAGFLTYRHSGDPADVVYSRYALHHLPDFWKAIALSRIAGVLRPGGVLRLWDVVYSFEPADAERRIEAWITETMTADVERGWTRSELAEHVRDEHSTFTWLLEPMIERAGLDVIDARYSASGVFARYLCKKR